MKVTFNNGYTVDCETIHESTVLAAFYSEDNPGNREDLPTLSFTLDNTVSLIEMKNNINSDSCATITIENDNNVITYTGFNKVSNIGRNIMNNNISTTLMLTVTDATHIIDTSITDK